jgi:hypothetical protein
LAIALAASVLLRAPARERGEAGTMVAAGTVTGAVSPGPQAHPEKSGIAVAAPVTVVATRDSVSSNEYMLPPLPMPGERPGYLRLREQVLERGPEALRPADAAAPIWMPDPAGRRLIRPASVLKG